MDAVDMTGRQVGEWTVLRRAAIQHAHGMIYWSCRCGNCGQVFNVSGSSLRSGNTSRCRKCAALNRKPAAST
jgi:NAD-dependent SIR2 family protein deacetylase